MSSNTNSSNNSNPPLSVPSSSVPPIIPPPKNTLEGKLYNVKFEKINGNKFKINAQCDNKNYISNEILFNKIKSKHDIKYETIDNFIESINRINREKDPNNIILYFDSNNLRIRYDKLCKNEFGYPITFLVKNENREGEGGGENRENNKSNNNINNISVLNNSLENSNYNIDDKKIQRNSDLIINILKKIPLILYQKQTKIKEQLAKYYKNKILVFELLFSLARDGNDIRNFHNLVENQNETLLLFETNEKKIFFYYIPISWKYEINKIKETNKQIQIKADKRIFFFDLKKNKIIAQNNLAIGCYSSYGPMIGEFNEDETNFIEKLDFDCSINFYEAFSNNKEFKNNKKNSENVKIKIKELEIYSIKSYDQ